MTRLSTWLQPARLALLLGIVAVAVRLALFLVNGAFAVHYPYELDYGEGIVWEQADLMLAGKGYGDITAFPFIVFHYPPVFHLAASGVNALLPGDWLAAARQVSLLATLAAAALCAWFVTLASTRDDDRLTGMALAVVLFVSTGPVIIWSALARVDMIALALTLGGLTVGIRSLERPRLLPLAALLFVLAVYARQTMVFAPAALFGTMLLVRPKQALKGIGWAMLFGLVIMAVMMALTGGRFVQHIFLYNVNRFSLENLQRMVDLGFLVQPHHWLLVVASAGFLAWTTLRSRDPADAATGTAGFAIRVALAYLLVSLLSLALVAKLGSNVNYFVDLCAAGALLAGAATARFRARALPTHDLGKLLPPALLMVLAMTTVITIPQTHRKHAEVRLPLAVLDREVAAIRAADKPVITDDMVLVKKAGKNVVWETAIFTELAWAGMWDERLMLDRIARGEFAYIRTLGTGRSPYDGRYRPDVIATIDRAYPVVVRQGRYFNHYPAGADGMSAAY